MSPRPWAGVQPDSHKAEEPNTVCHACGSTLYSDYILVERVGSDLCYECERLEVLRKRFQALGRSA